MVISDAWILIQIRRVIYFFGLEVQNTWVPKEKTRFVFLCVKIYGNKNAGHHVFFRAVHSVMTI
mgnify:CR=1 FL=1